MWVEQRPEEGDTVKVEFAEWTKLGNMIGIFHKFHSGFGIVEFGDMIRHLPQYSTFFVWV